MAKLIQTYNGNAQEVTSGSNIALGAVDRSFNACGTYSFNGSDTINISTCGYYEINMNAIATSSTEDTISLGIYQNNVLVALAQITSSSTTDTLSFSLNKIIRVFPNTYLSTSNLPSSITIKNAGVSSIAINAINVSIKKVC